jgi:IPT/TIG domain
MGGPVRHVARLGLAFTLALSAVGLADVRAAQAASPTVLAFLPLSGPVGTSVTITGLGFQDSSPATGVAFNGTAASFTVDSTTQITATVPSGATTGPISVTDSEGTGTTLLDFTVTPSSPPTILSFLPLSGPVGMPVTITGTGFTGASSVAFAGEPATFDVISDLQIDTVVPAHAGTGPISVTTPGGVATSLLDFTVPVSHRRSVGLRLRKHLRAIGRVATHDGFGACESNASVTIQRRRHGSWRTVKHDVTNARGRYRVAMKDRRGTYRTIVRRTEVNGGQHVCRRAVSRIRRRP